MKTDRHTYAPALASFLLILMLPASALAELIEIDDATFLVSPTIISNPYWPLYVGAIYGYRAITEDECEFNQLIVTGNTHLVEAEPGVFINTRVIRDQEWITEVDDDGNCDLTTAEIHEDTLDYYAQDDGGNIWYLGELTYAKEDEDGICSIVSDGSWQAGQPIGDPEVEPARAGIVMLANPQPGNRYQQEFLEDEAEDWGAVLRLDTSVSIEEGDYTQCLKTKEWTPLEPGSVEHKYYCLSPLTGTGYTPGLVYIEELKSKTVKVEFIGSSFPAGLPGNNDAAFPSTALSCD